MTRYGSLSWLHLLVPLATVLAGVLYLQPEIRHEVGRCGADQIQAARQTISGWLSRAWER